MDFDSFYLTNNNILTKKNKKKKKKINLEEIVEKVQLLEMWRDRLCAACNTNTVVPALLPTERQPQAASQHFGLDSHQRAHWADVYSRLVAAGLLHSDEVTSANFTFLLCGIGTPAPGPIRWHGTTRGLAYMVRNYLQSRWEVALYAFNDKNGRPLPPTLKNTKAPSPQTARTIDRCFRPRD